MTPATPSIPILPTIEDYSRATTHWKTYVNARWGVSFKYPDTWFAEKALESDQQGDAVNFYLNGVTPLHGDTTTNAVLVVENRDWHKESTNEQFISEARNYDGRRVLMVAGKPIIRGDGYGGEWYYEIKLSNTRELLLAAYNEEAGKKLDALVSTIKLTNE